MALAGMRGRCRERVRRIARSELDVDALRFAVVDELRRAIGFTAWGWPLADPASVLATTGIADPAMWPIVPRLVDYEERKDDLNKDRELAAGDRVALLSAASHGALERSARHRDILAPYGFGDELRAACVDRHGCWGHLRLYREARAARFDDDDAELLRAVVPELAAALRVRAARPIATSSVEPLETRVVVLDEALGVRSWTRGASGWFDGFVGASPPRGPNARCAVFAVAARCLAGDGPAPRARIRLPDGRWAVTEAARLDGETGVVVTVRAATTHDVLDILTRAYALTPRQRELVDAVARGLDTREIAHRLSISPLTVQQHLKSVFDRVGVRSRRELVVAVLGRPA